MIRHEMLCSVEFLSSAWRDDAVWFLYLASEFNDRMRTFSLNRSQNRQYLIRRQSKVSIKWR